MAMLTIAGLLILSGAIFGWVSFFQVRTLKDQVNALQNKLNSLSGAQKPVETTSPSVSSSTETSADRFKTPTAIEQPSWETPVETQTPTATPELTTPAQTPNYSKLMANLREHWMILLGGICIGLAGIFMVKYSIDAGLLSPTARIGLAIVSALLLHGVADWLHRTLGGPQPAFAALAGGASITLYAAFLAALHLYQLMSPNFVFIMLAIISLATMALSLRQGPVLAIIGILGGFVVPILLFDDSGNILGALLYSLIISASALLLMRRVYRSWLWLGMLAGGFGWWWISITSNDADPWRGLYIAALSYLIAAVPQGDFLLQGVRRQTKTAPIDWWESPLLFIFNKAVTPLEASVLLVLIATSWSILIQPFDQQTLLQWGPLTALILVLGAAHPNIKLLPWAYLLTQLGSWFVSRLHWDQSAGFQIQMLPEALQQSFLVFAAFMVLFYCLLGATALRKKADEHLWSSLVFISPLLWFALCFLLVSDLTSSIRWSSLSVGIGVAYLGFAAMRLKKSPSDVAAIWLIFAGHAGYSLAAAMFFREAGLTLVLAAQLVSLAMLINYFNLTRINWLLKLILAIVVARLSLNPWLLSYPSDIHWSLWSYGGSTLFAGISCYLLRNNVVLRKWLEAATLHLLVLSLGAEVRYWLYNGDIFSFQYSLTEASINALLWSGLSLCYIYRARFAENLQPIYLLLSNILLVLSSLNYLAILTVLNPLWSSQAIGNQPVFNLLLLAYGAPLLLCYLVLRFHLPKYRLAAACTLGAGLFIFVSLEIRHLWQGFLSLGSPTGNGELYTYSVVWMMLAVAAILLAYLRKQQLLYRAGIGLLAVVIGKIFLVDMSDLEGLLRVASFLGLGLVLLSLAYLHRLLGFAPSANNHST